MEDFTENAASYSADQVEARNEECYRYNIFTHQVLRVVLKELCFPLSTCSRILDAVCHDTVIYAPEERVMVLLPLHHIFSLMGTMIAPLYVNAMLVINNSLAAERCWPPAEISGNNHDWCTSLVSVAYKGLNEKIRHSAVAKLLLKYCFPCGSLSFSRFLFKTVHKKFGGHLKYMVCGVLP